MQAPPATDLASALRDLRASLDRLPPLGEPPALERAKRRLDRDLLPGALTGGSALVVGVVGPNNAGKSALFNGLVGRDLSPSLVEGGATRRLVGAAAPALAQRLRDEPTWGRFTLRPWTGAGKDADLPRRPTDDPDELLLAEVEGLPEWLLLIDTPDFDSVLRENRLASESLLTVAHVAIAVVTRHTYQNAEVVEFLARWLALGRPWILVYNEAPDDETAREHASKLASDLGSEPLAVFAAPHDLSVQKGAAPLVARSVEDGSGLREHLADLGEARELQRRALEASLGQLAVDCAELAQALAERRERAAALLAHADAICAEAGRAVAGAAMPLGPLLAAFRTVLDRRSGALRRAWRAGFGAIGSKVAALRSVIGSRPPRPEVVEGGLAELEARALERGWPRAWERLARDLGPEGRDPQRGAAPADLAAALDRDLGQPPGEGLAAARRAVASLPTDFAGFENACEQLVEQALEERGFEWDMQAAADLATLLPIAIAGGVMVTTGGFGVDAAVAGGGLFTSFVLDRFRHLLGAGVTRDAKRRWEQQRGGAIARAVYAAALPESGEALRRVVDEGESQAELLRAFAEGGPR